MDGITHSEHPAAGDRTLVRIDLFRRSRHVAPIALGVLLVSAIAALDWTTGPEVSTSLLYAVAVMAVTWVGSRRHGVLVAVLSAVQGLAAHAADPESVAITATAVWNAATRLAVLILMASLLGSLRRALIEQRHLAAVDPMTGSLNRRAFQIAAERERLRAARTGAPLSLAYLDIDRFKEFNDRHGHRTGDRILAALARAVTDSVRGTDLFARIGGDEFAVFLPDTDARDAVKVIHRIRDAVRTACCGESAPITISAGIATFRYPPASVDTIVESADQLMYRAKRAGGDRVVGAVLAGPWLRWADDSLKSDLRATHRKATVEPA